MIPTMRGQGRESLKSWDGIIIEYLVCLVKLSSKRGTMSIISGGTPTCKASRIERDSMQLADHRFI